jgi:hypothetical protein
LKVKGRSTGDSTLRLLGVPQFAQPILATSDDFPVKLFGIFYDTVLERMSLYEAENVDATGGGNLPLVSLSVRGNSVRAEGASYNRTVGSTTINFTVRLRLTRVGD